MGLLRLIQQNRRHTTTIINIFYYLYPPVFRGEGIIKRSILLSFLKTDTAIDYNVLVTVIRSLFSTQPRDADTCRFASNVYRLHYPHSGTEVEVNSSHSPPLKTNYLHHC